MYNSKTVSLFSAAVTAGTTATETLVSMIMSINGVNTSTADSNPLTTGSILRLSSLTLGMKGHTTPTAAAITFTVRINKTGAATVSSTPVFSFRLATPATADIGVSQEIHFPEGFNIEITPTTQIAITTNSVYVTNAPTYNVALVAQII